MDNMRSGADKAPAVAAKSWTRVLRPVRFNAEHIYPPKTWAGNVVDVHDGEMQGRKKEARAIDVSTEHKNSRRSEEASGGDIAADHHPGRAEAPELELYRLRTALQRPNGANKDTLQKYHDSLILAGNVGAALNIRNSDAWAIEFPATKKGLDKISARLIASQIDDYTNRLVSEISKSPHDFALYLSSLKRHNKKTYDNLRSIISSTINNVKFRSDFEKTSLKLSMEKFFKYGIDITRDDILWFVEHKALGTLSILFQSALSENGRIFEEFVLDLLEDPQGVGQLSLRAALNIIVLGYALLNETIYERLLRQVHSAYFDQVQSDGSSSLDKATASLHRITSSFLSSGSPGTYSPRERLRIAVCVSGQLRGYARAFETWRHLHLDEHDVRYFVHTWEDIGWRFPDPISGNGVNRVFKHKSFVDAYRQAGFRYGIQTLRNAYPNFFSALDISSTASTSDIKAVYGEDAVIVIENHRRPEFEDDHNNQRKMFYKIEQAHKLALEDNERYDLIVRIRPDRSFRAGRRTPDWKSLAKIASQEQIIFINNKKLTEGGLYVGDQFAFGAPEAMNCYANTLALQGRAINEKWFGFPQRLCAHASLANSLLFQGVKCRPFDDSIDPAAPLPAAEYNKAEIKLMLSADLPHGPITEMDHLLWNALS
ncbi:hypothetical protein PPNSA23_41660 [Phyllobacterium phragmitis]|uniref:Uncharacterized protein n=2 Tax=Phyllobacterium phragmitis TaxID=2670329 RepID=A0ABQ0H5K5_9HYPH